MTLNVLLLVVLIVCSVGVVEAQFKKRVVQNQLYQAQKLTKKYKDDLDRYKNQHTEHTNLANIDTLATQKLNMVKVDDDVRTVGSITDALMSEEKVNPK